jgi:hypothetical protein
MAARQLPVAETAVAMGEREPRGRHRTDRDTMSAIPGDVSAAGIAARSDHEPAATVAIPEALMAAPNINSIAPNTGLPNTATAVTITGVGFTGATAVTFGGAAATVLVVVSDTEITCDTPLIVYQATVDVVVTTPGGSNTMHNGFSFKHPVTPPGSGIVFPAFYPIIPPPPFGLPPPPTFPPTTGTTPVAVPRGPLVGPAVAFGTGPTVSGAGGGSHPIVFPGFSTTFPNPPVSAQTTPPPPTMITTTAPIVLNGWGPHAPGGTLLLSEEGDDDANPLHHGNPELPERRAGPVFQPRNADELHQPEPPKGGGVKRVPPRSSSRHRH